MQRRPSSPDLSGAAGDRGERRGRSRGDHQDPPKEVGQHPGAVPQDLGEGRALPALV